jgi:hypothetical protein
MKDFHGVLERRGVNEVAMPNGTQEPGLGACCAELERFTGELERLVIDLRSQLFGDGPPRASGALDGSGGIRPIAATVAEVCQRVASLGGELRMINARLT